MLEDEYHSRATADQNITLKPKFCIDRLSRLKYQAHGVTVMKTNLFIHEPELIQIQVTTVTAAFSPQIAHR